jgi:tetrahydromethanopterin S-methyltransferase subunit F
MSDWGVYYAIGMATGLAIGFIVGKRQEPWSELSQKQKRIMIGSIAAGVVLLVVGMVVALILMR